MKTMTKTCLECGRKFETEYWLRKYCSDKCRRRHYYSGAGKDKKLKIPDLFKSELTAIERFRRKKEAVKTIQEELGLTDEGSER